MLFVFLQFAPIAFENAFENVVDHGWMKKNTTAYSIQPFQISIPSRLGFRVDSAVDVHQHVLRKLARVPHLEVSARSAAVAIEGENGTVRIFSRKHLFADGFAAFDGMSYHVHEHHLVAELAFFLFVFLPGPRFHTVVPAGNIAGVLIVGIGDSHGFFVTCRKYSNPLHSSPAPDFRK